MASDQNSIPIDLRPLNIARTMAEESRIGPVTTSGRNIEGFVGIGYGNAVQGVTGWLPRVPGANSTPECYYNNPNFGSRVSGNASEQASDEGGDDSVSGKKVKFLCSFGGKILPRPSDGALRYVGGQTRIISVRRETSFNELVQKMVDACGQNVVIKYQLPEEDLDALVSVSCPDDMENMMDEYQKLVERSSDGSAKLRVFLFSASELDLSSMVQVGDLPDSGQRYMEAVNGIVDGVGGVLRRKESITSAASTQNSDVSATEAVDGIGHGQGDVTGPPSTSTLSPRGDFANSQETAPRLVCVDPNPAIYVDSSGAPLGIPMVRSGAPPNLSGRPEQEFGRSVPVTVHQQQQICFDLQKPGVTFPPPAPYLQTYADPHQETLNRADYVQFPSQMGFPTQLMGTVGPMFNQQQFLDNTVGVSPHQFISAAHMTMTPSSHVSIRPNVGPPLVQPQQVRLEHYPGDQSYNAYQAQVHPTVVGGGFVWHQAPRPEQMSFSEGWVPHQQVMFPEQIPRHEDCFMCQKALPHAHSDTVTHGRKESPTTKVSDLNSVYQSPQVDDSIRGHLMNRAAVTGALGHIDHESDKPQLGGVAVPQNVEGLYGNDRTILQKADNPDYPKVTVPQDVVGLAGGLQSPYSVFMGTIPQLCQENPVGGMPSQTSGHIVQESSKDYSGKIPGINPKEDALESCFTYDHLRPIDGRMENLQMHSPTVFLKNELSKSPVDNPRKEDVLESRPEQIAGREPCLDSIFSNPKMIVDANRPRQNEMLPCSSNEVPSLLNFQPVDSYEVGQVAQLPYLGNPSYPPSQLGVNHLAPDEVSYGNPAFSGLHSAHVTERIPPIGEWKNNPSQFHPKMVPGDVEAFPSDANFSTSVSPSNMVGDMQDSSNSLFSNQDPWNLQHDTHFPPPRPNKILMKKETFGTRDPFSDDHYGNNGDLMAEMRLEDGVYQPSSNLNVDFSPEQVWSSKGSAEEQIKQELQAVAEGVAASVLQSSTTLNSDLTIHGMSGSSTEANQNSEVQDSDLKMRHKDRFEDMNTKLPEKTNVGFPVSDGIGRLQIIKNDDLEELRELGSGTFGTVYHGKWRGSDVAIKRINDRCFAGKPSEQERMRNDFWNEAIKLADLHHPNVVAFYGVVLDGPGGTVATVTEFMVNGSLRNALQKNERNLDKRKRLIIAMDVAFGMEYLHGKNIVHFDLKSDNLLVNLRDPHRPICKVGDLGLSKVKCQTLISGGVRGTLPWMAPELLNGSSSLVSEKVDVFSFGIVLWELLTGDEPYADLHYGAIIGGIVSNTLRPPVPESCDPEWRSLMERCWSAEPLERPNFTEIANQLRIMAAKVPPKVQIQQQPLSAQTQAKT